MELTNLGTARFLFRLQQGILWLTCGAGLPETTLVGKYYHRVPRVRRRRC